MSNLSRLAVTCLVFSCLFKPAISEASKLKAPSFKHRFGYKAFNFNFEELSANKSPTKWLLKGDHTGNTVDKANKIAGEQALYLSTLDAKTDMPSSFIHQHMDVSFPREHINLSAYVQFKPASPDSKFTLMLTIIDKSASGSPFKHVSYQLKNDQPWQEIKLSLPLLHEAQYISVTGYLQGKGELWLDALGFDFKPPKS